MRQEKRRDLSHAQLVACETLSSHEIWRQELHTCRLYVVHEYRRTINLLERRNASKERGAKQPAARLAVDEHNPLRREGRVPKRVENPKAFSGRWAILTFA